MKNETKDIVYRCKDCIKYNLCSYYHRRKETSQICHYFELPERKTGKWKLRTDTMYHYECPFCGYLHQYKDNFCPLCGARMEVDE